MSFLLKPERPVGHELRRVIDRQLAGAIVRLETVDSAGGREALHEARKHVKKARTVLRVLRPWLGKEFDSARRRLRTANRRLGPFADAWAMVDTLDHFLAFDPAQPSVPTTTAALRAHLVEGAARLERQIDSSRVRDRVVRLLAGERQRLEARKAKARARSVIDGIAEAHRRAGAAKRAAFARPSAKTFHRWRQRVKSEWYLVRLVSKRCGDRLDADERRLEALDGCLGELHNVSTLIELISADSPISRRDTAECLWAFRAYRRTLRHQAHEMGRIYAERPSRLAARVQQAWDSPVEPTPGIVTGPWPRVA